MLTEEILDDIRPKLGTLPYKLIKCHDKNLCTETQNCQNEALNKNIKST